jgi:hypothetical protein
MPENAVLEITAEDITPLPWDEQYRGTLDPDLEVFNYVDCDDCSVGACGCSFSCNSSAPAGTHVDP